MAVDLDQIIKDQGAEELAPTIKSIYQTESSSGRADTSKVGPGGALGPMQVIKSTFDQMKAEGRIPKDAQWNNPYDNAAAGVAYIKSNSERFNTTDPYLLRATYLGGPGVVRPDGTIDTSRRDALGTSVGEYAAGYGSPGARAGAGSAKDTYEVKWNDGNTYRVELPRGTPSQMASYYVQKLHYSDTPQTPPADEGPSSLGIAARAAERNVIPAAVGSLVGIAASPLGSFIPGIGNLAAGYAGAVAAGSAVEKAQESFLEAHPDLAKALGQDAETRAADEAAHPMVSTLAGVGTNIIAGGFRPSYGGLKSLLGVGEEALGKAWGQTAKGAAIMGGINTAEQAFSDQPFDPYNLGLNALIGGTFHTPTALGKGFMRIGEGFTYGVTPKSVQEALKFPEREGVPPRGPIISSESPDIQEPAPPSVPTDDQVVNHTDSYDTARNLNVGDRVLTPDGRFTVYAHAIDPDTGDHSFQGRWDNGVDVHHGLVDSYGEPPRSREPEDQHVSYGDATYNLDEMARHIAPRVLDQNPETGDSVLSWGADIHPSIKPVPSKSPNTTYKDVYEGLKAIFGIHTNRLINSGFLRLDQSSPFDESSGYYDPNVNSVVFNVDNLHLDADGKVKPSFLKELMIHEIGVHANIKNMLGPDLYQKVLDRVDQGIKNNEAPFVEANNRVPANTNPIWLREERLAYLVGKHPELPLVKQIFSNIKTWFWQKMGGRWVDLTADDLRTLALSSLKKSFDLVEEGRLSGTKPGESPTGINLSTETTEENNIDAANAALDEGREPPPGAEASPVPQMSSVRVEAPPEPGSIEDTVGRIKEGMSQNEQKKVDSGTFIGKLKEFVQKFRDRPYTQLIEKFQDQHRLLSDLQKALELQHGKKWVIENGLNIGDAVTNTPSAAERPAVNNLTNTLHDALINYSKATGRSWSQSLADFKMWSIGITEPKLRDYLWRMRVPLSTDPIITLPSGSKISPADYRKQIVDTINNLSSEHYTKAERERIVDHLRDELNRITDGQYVDLNGYSPDEHIMATKAILRDDPAYSVVGNWHPETIEGFQKDLAAAREKFGPQIDAVFAAEKALREKVTDIERAAGKWGDHVDNWVRFNRRGDTYFTLKGSTERPDFDEITGQRVNRDLSKVVDAQEGRITESDNPITQTIADAEVGLRRLDNKALIDAVYNATKKNLIPGAKVLTEPLEAGEAAREFFENNNPDNVVLRPRPDGKYDVIQFKDKQWRDAVKGIITTPNPIISNVGRVTRGITLGFTRFNPAFAPPNAVRHGMTNLGNIMASEYGPLAAGQMMGRMFTQAIKGSPFKAARASYLIETGNKAKLEQLAKNDDFYKNILDWDNAGGRMSFSKAYGTNDAATRSVMESFNRKPVTRTLDQIKLVFDTYNNMFEFMNREAAFDTIKKANLRNGMTEEQAIESASAFTKNLLNLEKKGHYSQAMGSWFPMFKAEATGAVRQTDALLSPLFQSANSYLRSNWTRGMGHQVFDALYRLQQIEDSKKLGIKSLEGTKEFYQKIIDNDPGAQKFIENYNKLRRNAAITLGAAIGFGYMMYNRSRAMGQNDEDGRNEVASDDHRLWVRSMRVPVSIFGDQATKYFGKDTQFINMPWGFGAGAFASIGSQMAALANGDIKPEEAVTNMSVAAKESFLPLPVESIDMFKKNPMGWALTSAAPAPVRPLLEYAFNMDDFGRQIYNPRPSRYGEVGGDSTSEAFKSAADTIAKVTNGMWMPNPDELQFAFNQYAEGLTTIGNSVMSIYNFVTGKEDFDPKKDLPFLSSFLGRKTDVDARQYSEINDALVKNKKILDNFESRGFDDAYDRYVETHPDAEMLRQYYVTNREHLNKINAEMNKVRDQDQTPQERRDELEDYKDMRRMIMRDMVDTYNESEH